MGVNAKVPHDAHPPYDLPHLTLLLCRGLFLLNAYPGVKVKMAKVDIKSAYRQVWCCIETARNLSAALPGVAAGMMDKDILAACLSLAFGAAFSPAEYGVWAEAIIQVHSRLRPQEGWLNGTQCFNGASFVDDAALLEPEMGNRPHMSVAAYEWAAKQFFGQNCIQVEKGAVESKPSDKMTVWGYDINWTGAERDTSLASVGFVEAKLAKAARLIGQSDFDRDCRKVSRAVLAETTGLLEFIAPVCHVIKTEVTTLYGILSDTGDCDYLRFSGPESEQRWDEFWTAVEFLRMMLVEEGRMARFTRPVLTVIDPAVRLSIPREVENSVKVSTDAVPQVLGAIDFTAKKAYGGFMMDLRSSLQALGMGPPPECVAETEEFWIPMSELVAFIALALERCSDWAGRTVVHAIDNMLACSWLSHRRPRHPFARQLVRILSRLEVEYRFRAVHAYINTKSNVGADAISRILEPRARKASFQATQTFLSEKYPGLTLQWYQPRLLAYFAQDAARVVQCRLPQEALEAKLGPASRAERRLQLGLHSFLPLTLGGIFSGVNTFELDWHAKGGVVAFVVERNSWGNLVAAHMLKGAEVFCEFYRKKWLEAKANSVRALAAGPDCKSYSAAGKQLFADDPRAWGFYDTSLVAQRFSPDVVCIEITSQVITHDDVHGMLTATVRQYAWLGLVLRAVDLLEYAHMGGPFERLRAFFHFESTLLWKKLPEPQPIFQGDPHGCFDDVREPEAQVPESAYLSGTFEALSGALERSPPDQACRVGTLHWNEARELRLGAEVQIRTDNAHGCWYGVEELTPTHARVMSLDRKHPDSRRLDRGADDGWLYRVRVSQLPVYSTRHPLKSPRAWGQQPIGPVYLIKDGRGVRCVTVEEVARGMGASYVATDAILRQHGASRAARLAAVGEGIAGIMVDRVNARTMQRLRELDDTIARGSAVPELWSSGEAEKVALERLEQIKEKMQLPGKTPPVNPFDRPTERTTPPSWRAGGLSEAPRYPPRRRQQALLPTQVATRSSAHPGGGLGGPGPAQAVSPSGDGDPVASSTAEAEVIGAGEDPEPERAGPARDSRAIRCRLANPKQPGSLSHARYERYKDARSEAEFLLLGGTPADLSHDVGKGFVVYEDAGATRLTQDGSPGIAVSEVGDGGTSEDVASPGGSDDQVSVVSSQPTPEKAPRRRAARPHVAAAKAKPYHERVTRSTTIVDPEFGKFRDPVAYCKQGVQRLLLARLAPGSQTTYANQFRHWKKWRACGPPEQGLYLDGRDPVADEEELLKFVFWMGVTLGYQYSTVHVTLYAIRYMHIMQGVNDVLKDKPRLALAKLGLKRLSHKPRRKIAATIALLRDIMAHQDLTKWEDLLAITAVSFGFFFLLRASEYLNSQGGAYLEYVIRVGSLTFLDAAGHELCPGVNDLGSTRELIVTIPGSKTDKYNQGQRLNVHYSADALNPIGLLLKMWRMRPGHFSSPERFLFQGKDGPLKREVVSKLLKDGAVRLGADPRNVAPHSLRAGGATAMYNAGYSTAEIQLRGRWVSDCWMIYIWQGRGISKKLVERLCAVDYAPLAL